MASLKLEFRWRTDQLAQIAGERWLSAEVHTANARPEVTMLWDQLRHEGGYTVVAGVQGGLIRSNQRVIDVRLKLPQGEHSEAFMPKMPRMPDPQTPWSDWMSPQQVFDPRDDRAKPQALLQMRWRVELYGQ